MLTKTDHWESVAWILVSASLETTEQKKYRTVQMRHLNQDANFQSKFIMKLGFFRANRTWKEKNWSGMAHLGMIPNGWNGSWILRKYWSGIEFRIVR